VFWVNEPSKNGRKRAAEFTAYIAKYADFDYMFLHQPSQLDQNKDDCYWRYCQRTSWDGAVFVSKQFCTPLLRQKRGLFHPANESVDRQNRNDIPNIYGKGCEYGSIDILLGFLMGLRLVQVCKNGTLVVLVTVSSNTGCAFFGFQY
jgi:hypothetical protein